MAFCAVGVMEQQGTVQQDSDAGDPQSQNII